MARIHPTYRTAGALIKAVSFFEVPEYQRDYAWGADEINQFWDDLLFAIDDSADEYFLGSMVFMKTKSPNTMEVVDGQQRLTTITLLLTALKHFVDDDRTKSEIEKYIGAWDRKSKVLRPKILLNDTNRSFYRSRIVEAETIEAISTFQKSRKIGSSNRLLAKATCDLYERLASFFDEASMSRDEVADAILDALDTKITIITIDVDDMTDAFRLFETLNDRGLALTVSDLLKNYLLKIGGQSRKEILSNWKLMSDNLDQIDSVRFIRHSWMAKYGKIRNKILYKSITEKYASEADAVKLSATFAEDARTYAALSDPASDLWSRFGEKTHKLRNDLRQINTFRIVSFHPLLLAIYNQRPDIFVQTVRLVAVVAFRYFVIGGQGAGNAETYITEFTRKFQRDPSEWNISRIFNELEPLYISDSAFREDFAARKMTNAQQARLILRTIAEHMQDGEFKVDDDASNVNLEHILPKKFDDSWSAHFHGDREVDPAEYVDRIGNMTLLEKTENSSIGNAPYEKKKEAYQKSWLDLTKNISRHDDWGPEAIDARQSALSKIATSIWRYDL